VLVDYRVIRQPVAMIAPFCTERTAAATSN
jgi:hypothetical protein